VDRGGRGVAARAGGPAAATVAPATWGNLPISVTDSDIADLAMSLRVGVTVKGRAILDDMPSPDVAVKAMQQTRLMLQQIGSAGGRAGRAGAAGGVGAVADDGSFSFTGITPGRYVIVASAPNGWVTRTIMAAGRDASDIPLEIIGDDINDATVTFTTHAGSIAGTVRATNGTGDPNAFVILYPTDARAWGWTNGIHSRSTRTSATGTYSFANLPPGDYVLSALVDDSVRTWQDSAFLQTLSRGATRVRVADDGHLTQDLKTTAIK
jgi:hypothetical protein